MNGNLKKMTAILADKVAYSLKFENGIITMNELIRKRIKIRIRSQR